MLILALVVACSTPSPEAAAPAEPAPDVLAAEVVPVPEPAPEPVAQAVVVDSSSPAVTKLVAEATTVFGDHSFVVTAALVDSQDAGADGWRSCAKLTPASFGIPDAMPHLFLTEKDKSCEEDPDGFVTKILAAGLSEAVFLPPEFNGEKMAVVSTSTVPTAATQLSVEPAEPATADGAK